MTDTRSSKPAYPLFLERGKACIDCRRRKLKCDGGWPSCGRCIRAGHGEDCEYMDELGRTKTQVLEDSIARLEARIRELESLGATATAVALHEPHLYGNPPNNSFSSWRTLQDHTSSGSGRKSSGGTHLNVVNSTNTPQVHTARSFEQLTLPHGWWASEEPPPDVVQIVVGHFIPHAAQFGFFLNISRFLSSIFPSGSQRFPERPASSLLSVVYLFGVHLSLSQALTAHESVFLARAVRSTASAMISAPHPHQVTHIIQAEVLLSHYFLRNGRFLEAMHRMNAAISLSIGCGLHRLSSSDHIDPAFVLSPPQDDIEKGERVDGFWTVVILHKCWGIALQWPSTVSDVLDQQIITPWPLEMGTYESGQPTSYTHGYGTLKNFVDNPAAEDMAAACSPLALRVKAATLFERASYLGVRWKSDLTDSEEYTHFVNLDMGLNKFIQGLTPSWTASPAPIDAIRNRLVTYTLAQVAVIQLHVTFADGDTLSARKCLMAAQAVVVAIEYIPNISEWQCIDPIMGTLWVAVCQIFVRGISSIKASPSAGPGWSSSVSTAQHASLMAGLDRVTATMSIFGSTCPLIEFQRARVQEAFSAI